MVASHVERVGRVDGCLCIATQWKYTASRVLVNTSSKFIISAETALTHTIARMMMMMQSAELNNCRDDKLTISQEIRSCAAIA